MTALTPNDRFVSLSPAAATTVLAYDFELLLDTGLTVQRIRAGVLSTLTLGVDYTFPGGLGNEAGGTLTLSAGSLAGDVYQLIGAQPEQRLSDFVASQKFDSAKMNTDLDALTIVTQEHRRDIARGWKSAYGTAGGEIDAGADGELVKFEDGNIVGSGENVDSIIGSTAAAAAARDAARKWATEAEDVPVDDGVNPSGFSAFNWMRKALGYASSASAQAIAAAASAVAAAAAVAAVALPNPAVASTFLQRNAGNTAYDAKSAVEVRNALAAAAFVADRTAVKALDPTKDKAATTYSETSRNGTWIAILTSTLTASEQALATADTSEAVYLTSGLYTWKRHFTGSPEARWWNVKADGATDDRAALNAAANSGHKHIDLPAGSINYGSAWSIPDYVTLTGKGSGTTLLVCTYGSGNCITVGVDATLERVGLNHSATRTSGVTVVLNGNLATLQNVEMQGYFIGISMKGASSAALIVGAAVRNVTGRLPATGAGSGAIDIDNYSSCEVLNCVITGTSGTQPDFGARIAHGDTIYLTNNNITQHGRALYVAPQAGQVAYSITSTGNHYDNANGAGASSAMLAPVAGHVRNFKSVGDWFGFSASGSGLFMQGASAGTVDGVQLIAPEFMNNGDSGLRIDGTLVKNVLVLGWTAAANVTAAINISSGTTRFKIKDGFAGDIEGRGVNGRGILIQAGASDYYDITGNTCIGNTTAQITDSGTGINKRVKDNITDASTSVASTATVTLPTDGDFFTVTGTTTITSITASSAGRRVTLLFSGILTLTDGSNLKLSANFVTSADDIITLICDGTNWLEESRSAN